LIKLKLFRTRAFKKAKRVMFYVAFDGEVDTREMITHARKLGKIIAVPVCSKDRSMQPCLLSPDINMSRGLYGILEPAIKKFINLEKLDLVIVPGVAFSQQGSRLGRGKGYYDRFLGRLPGDTPSIGLAFDFQVLPCVPVVSTDSAVHKVIQA